MPIDDLTALGQKMREARKNKELTQQELSDLSHVSVKQIANIEKGGYILKDTDGTPDVIVIATGSEVELAMEAAAING